jgi:hypothetical protein
MSKNSRVDNNGSSLTAPKWWQNSPAAFFCQYKQGGGGQSRGGFACTPVDFFCLRKPQTVN